MSTTDPSESAALKEATMAMKTESEWKAELSPIEFRVLRKKGTEPAGSGEYNKFYPVCALIPPRAHHETSRTDSRR